MNWECGLGGSGDRGVQQHGGRRRWVLFVGLFVFLCISLLVIVPMLIYDTHKSSIHPTDTV